MEYEITPEEVKSKLESGADFTLLDCRDPWEYQTARIEQAVNIPMGEIPARAGELDRDKHIVVVCHHGVRSMRVTAWLRQQVGARRRGEPVVSPRVRTAFIAWRDARRTVARAGCRTTVPAN